MTWGQVGRAMLVALLWGAQFATSKVGLESFPPLFFVGLRFTGVAVLLLPLVGAPARGEWRGVAAVSLFYGSLCFGLFFAGLRLSTAGIAAVLAQLMTPFTILFAWPILNERPSGRVVFGVMLAFAGAFVALGGTIDAAAPWAGGALVTMGAASQGFGNVLVRRLLSVPPLRLIGWMAALAAPQLLLASALFEQGQAAAVLAAPMAAWGSLAYAIGIGAIVAFAIWFGLLRELPLARVAPYALLQTIFGIAAGILFLDESLTVPIAAGALVCMVGVALTQMTAAPTHRATGREL